MTDDGLFYSVHLIISSCLSDRDENVYNNCEKPVSTAWKHQRVNTNEMELVITVQDVDDNAPVFSQPSYTVAVVRDTPPPTTLIKLEVSAYQDVNNVFCISWLEKGLIFMGRTSDLISR